MNNPNTNLIKILYFFPHNPFPPRSGAHIRCLDILKALIALNCEVIFVSSEMTSESIWNQSGIEHLHSMGIKSVHIYHETIFDRMECKIAWIFYRILQKIPPVDSVIYSPFGMSHWFHKLQSEVMPDVIWINYAFWDSVIDKKNLDKITRVIDYLDFVSSNVRMSSTISDHISRNSEGYDEIDDELLNENYFSDPGFSIDPKELQILNNYDVILAITQYEAEIIRHQGHNNVIHIPVTYEITNNENKYDGPVVFVAGQNAFNIQGYFYFVNKVLPLILQEVPTFRVQIIGSLTKSKFRSRTGAELLGYVDDLDKFYNGARFFICPVIGGTGQQIKIIEAMAHGLPVVATSYSAKTSPIIHGVNGYIAKTPVEFKDFCVRLWQNPELCQTLGNNARLTIKENFSNEILVRRLSEIIKKISKKSGN